MGEITRCIIVAWIFANGNKWCTWVDWWLKDGTCLLQVTANILYHHGMASLSGLSLKARRVWNVCKSDARWWQILQHGWHSHLPFCAKVFRWRVMKGGLPFGLTLKRWGLGSDTCFFCTIPLDDNSRSSIKIHIMHMIWNYLSDVWQISTRCYLSLNNEFLLYLSKWRAGDFVPIYMILGTTTQSEYA